MAGLLACSAVAPAAVAAPVPMSAAPAPSSSPSSTPTVHPVPPAAPAPTDSGNSPAAPDPHPPQGGLGPDGKPVGGARLLSRHNILPAGAPALPDDLTAQSWMITDLDTGKVIAARDPHGRYQPASIQKLLTSITLLPLLPGDRTVTVSRASAETEGSHAGIVAGGRYTISQLFEGLLLVSGNDCAEALAAAAGGRAQTVALMNQTALALGAYDTFVQTPSGLDGWQQLTSAYDMTLFLRAALAQPRFVRYDKAARTTLPEQKVNGFGPVDLVNQNEQFLTMVKGAVVAKTGFTDAAQHTFVGAIERGGHRYGVVLMRAQRYPDDQWVQATKLVDWARSLPNSAKPVGTLVTPPPTAVAAVAGPALSTPATTSLRAAATSDSHGLRTAIELLLIVVIGSVAAVCTLKLVRFR